MSTDCIPACLTRGLAALLLALAGTTSVATPTDIASAPLVTASTTEVRPNLMFILDNSGSMHWDFMPDWVRTAPPCRSGAADATSSGTWGGTCCRHQPASPAGDVDRNCLINGGPMSHLGMRRPDPPYLASPINGVAYNPATTYLPARRADGTPMPSMTHAATGGWSAVPNDAFGAQNTHLTNLVTQFPDTEWCTDTHHTDCLRQGNYVLPGRVDGRNYHVFRAVTATGTGHIAVGNPFNATIAPALRAFGPHYFVIVPAEHCTAANLRDCVLSSTPTSTHPHPAPLRWCNSDANSRALTPAAGACQATRAGAFVHARFPTKIRGPAGEYPGRFERVDIVPGATFPRAPTRTDCAAATECTYEEEMTNFANWWAYHRTRMQTMKSATSLGFSGVSDRLRLGFKSINEPPALQPHRTFLNLDTFGGAHRSAWFDRLLAARPSGSTPLRRSLSTVGRLYAGRLNGATLQGSIVVEPMQHSCQRNITLLSTDGFWNETGLIPRIDGSTPIGDVDGRAGIPRPLHDGTATPNSLSDVALHYHETDLRTPALGNCAGPGGADLCPNNVPSTTPDPGAHQRMTTFTLGLGVPGFMQFQPDYLTATSGDFHAVANGLPANPAAGVCSWRAAGMACTWPQPVAGTLTTIDDLWHAAVNGRGTYFAATDPASLYTGIRQMLEQITNRVGAAAAATTSNPNVSAGDNYVFLSSYVSGAWLGQLSGKSIDLVSGEVLDSTGDWHAAQLLTSDVGRNILFFDATAAEGLRSFTWANLAGRTDPDGGAPLRSYFELPHITAPGRALSQFCSFGSSCLPSAAQSEAAGERLLNFIRGARADEGPDIDTTRFFRQRTFADPATGLVMDTVLGSIVNSEAVYVGRTPFRFADSGFAAYQAATAARAPMVYVGSNGGMLHAFDARTGNEVWAYVPTMVMRNLYHLADKDYANRHRFYVDSTPAVADVVIGGQWRTLLVGGLGAGGRGYFALDVTDPNAPRGLWEFTHANLGLSFGRPEIARLRDGTWVVLLASGHNNVSPGDGRGRLFVLDAATGALIRSIDTGAGSVANPAGLAHIRAWVEHTEVDNTVERVYGGDLLGNVWRFDVNGDVGAAGFDAQRLATLRGPEAGSPAQPITSRPELGLVAGRPMVYVGTGRYLGVSDLSSTGVQSIYAIEDLLDATDHGNPRASTRFAQQTLNPGTCPAGSSFCDPADTVRTGSGRAVNLASDDGWFVDLPAPSERITTDPQLALGTLVVTSNVVHADACVAGGSSFINFFDFRTGLPVPTAHGIASVALGNALATRPALMRLPGGKITSLTRMSNDSTVVRDIPVVQPTQGTRRLSWRELVSRER